MDFGVDPPSPTFEGFFCTLPLPYFKIGLGLLDGLTTEKCDINRRKKINKTNTESNLLKMAKISHFAFLDLTFHTHCTKKFKKTALLKPSEVKTHFQIQGGFFNFSPLNLSKSQA